MLDRLVGYKISPILWRRVRPGLSAGRVQSVAVRLIVEREREIQAFQPVEYWSDRRPAHAGRGRLEQRRNAFTARLTQIPDGKLATNPDKKGIVLGDEAGATTARRASALAPRYQVTNVERKERKRSPSPPFTTSTLQQEAARKLGFGARKTMTLAQRLYEGVNVPGEGIGRAHHLHADRLGEHRRQRDARDLRGGPQRLRRRVRARGAAPLQDALAQRAGGARGDPADVGAAAPGTAVVDRSTATSCGSTR